ncbi:hypothetical protein BCR39DRAFT_531477 [Naematelia encephala]|uniref:3-keto sterol reductase n=1 Tax=Naematelia encephala TaxID=71784 RepID=A0A1Y2B6C5_9TREE|nr:hypothetical protein BCR39DRAFT_531477 [Naematelia encephala]
MVTTRSSRSHPSPDENRMIAVVTGANAGFGFGICVQLLRNLSLPSGTPLPLTAQVSKIPDSPASLKDNCSSSSSSSELLARPPPTFTLILACRSQARAEKARTLLLARHDKELARRKKRGLPIREGWREGLRVEWEAVDLDAMGGKNEYWQKYPHITSLYLNAGITNTPGLNWLAFVKQIFVDGLSYAVSHPTFVLERAGVMSADGERGMPWGINVFAPYILARELEPMLRRSPASLPHSPRIVYTSSVTSTPDALKPDTMSDYQLLTYNDGVRYSHYKASKYMAEIIMVQLDQEFATRPETKGEHQVRCLTADPGCVPTDIFREAWGGEHWIAEFLFIGYWITFYLARLFGSPWHPVYTSEGASSMVYAGLVEDKYLSTPDKVPAEKLITVSSRWGKTTVRHGEVDRWEETQDLGRDLVQACETLRLQWRRREGLE